MRLVVCLGFLTAASLVIPVIPLPASARPESGLLISGMLTEGDAPAPFSLSIDLQRGFHKIRRQTGESETQSGFDGMPWEESNDIVVVSNLPSALADRRAEAWVESDAWRTKRPGNETSRMFVRRGMAPIELRFDPRLGRPAEAIISGDWGPETYRFSDWRKVGTLTYPFHREKSMTTGEHTTFDARSVKAVAILPRTQLARPVGRPHALSPAGRAVSVPFEGTGRRSTHILVAGAINGTPARLVFDTGALNYITSDVAQSLGLKVSGGVSFGGVGEGSEKGGFARVKRIALGGAELRDESVVVGPSPFPPSKPGAPPNAAGFVGFEFLAEYKTTIDYPRQQLSFSSTLPSPPNSIRVPFQNDGFHMFVRARVNGVEGLFGLDTGDGGTLTLFPEFAARHGLDKQAGVAKSDGGGMGGAVMASSGVANRFTLGSLRFDQLPIRFSHQKSGAFASRHLAGNLGGGVLQCFSITIDFPNRMLLLDPAPNNPYCRPGGTVTRTR